MSATESELYAAHAKNLRSLETALMRIFRELNSALSRDDKSTSNALMKTAMLLLGSWAEVRLLKLQFEPNGFDPRDRSIIVSERSQINRWHKALEIGFRKRNNLPRANLETALPVTHRAYFVTLRDALNESLEPLILVRNKLAHGQWEVALNSQNNNLAPTTQSRIDSENALSLKFKKSALNSLAQIINDLVAGNHAFERDIDRNFGKFENATRSVSTRSYSDWLTQMKEKYQRGKERKALV